MGHGKRIAILIGLLVAALVCYGIGMQLGALIFVIIGALLECGFWLRLFKTDSNK